MKRAAEMKELAEKLAQSTDKEFKRVAAWTLAMFKQGNILENHMESYLKGKNEAARLKSIARGTE